MKKTVPMELWLRRKNPIRKFTFAETYCVCGRSNIWDGNCKYCKKPVYTD